MKYLVYFETREGYDNINRSADLFKCLARNYDLLKFQPKWSNYSDEPYDEQFENLRIEGLFFYYEDKPKSTKLILEELVEEIHTYCYLEIMYLIDFEEAVKIYKKLYLKEVLENLEGSLWDVHESNEVNYNTRLESKNLDEMFFEDWNSTEYKNFKNSSNQDGTFNFNDYRLKQSTKLRQNNSLGFYSWLFSNRENLLSYDENNFNFIVEFYS